MRKSFITVWMAVLALVACAPPGISPSPTLTIAPALSPMPEPGCPEPTGGTQLLTREEMGYCLLYPEGYVALDTKPAQVCLVPGEPGMACHNAHAFINVEEAAGRTAGQIAEQIIAEAQTAESVERTTLTISGEEAVVLDGLPGVDSSRRIFMVHADRLYTLMFVPWDETGEAWARVESLYNTMINSFTFVSI